MTIFKINHPTMVTDNIRLLAASFVLENVIDPELMILTQFSNFTNRSERGFRYRATATKIIHY